jgi:hypothetical protein
MATTLDLEIVSTPGRSYVHFGETEPVLTNWLRQQLTFAFRSSGQSEVKRRPSSPP